MNRPTRHRTGTAVAAAVTFAVVAAAGAVTHLAWGDPMIGVTVVTACGYARALWGVRRLAVPLLGIGFCPPPLLLAAGTALTGIPVVVVAAALGLWGWAFWALAAAYAALLYATHRYLNALDRLLDTIRQESRPCGE